MKTETKGNKKKDFPVYFWIKTSLIQFNPTREDVRRNFEECYKSIFKWNYQDKRGVFWFQSQKDQKRLLEVIDQKDKFSGTSCWDTFQKNQKKKIINKRKFSSRKFNFRQKYSFYNEKTNKQVAKKKSSNFEKSNIQKKSNDIKEEKHKQEVPNADETAPKWAINLFSSFQKTMIVELDKIMDEKINEFDKKMDVKINELDKKMDVNIKGMKVQIEGMKVQIEDINKRLGKVVEDQIRIEIEKRLGKGFVHGYTVSSIVHIARMLLGKEFKSKDWKHRITDIDIINKLQNVKKFLEKESVKKLGGENPSKGFNEMDNFTWATCEKGGFKRLIAVCNYIDKNISKDTTSIEFDMKGRGSFLVNDDCSFKFIKGYSMYQFGEVKSTLTSQNYKKAITQLNSRSLFVKVFHKLATGYDGELNDLKILLKDRENFIPVIGYIFYKTKESNFSCGSDQKEKYFSLISIKL